MPMWLCIDGSVVLVLLLLLLVFVDEDAGVVLLPGVVMVEIADVAHAAVGEREHVAHLEL